MLVGRAYFATNPRGVSTTFRYDDAYLADRNAFALDPALPLFAGQHAVADGLPYSFTDCAPDRWGRNLMRLHALDVAAGRTRREVTDVDFLLGVSDHTRHGALRFTDPDSGPAGPFLAGDPDVPKLLELPRLLHAAEQVDLSDGDDLSAVKELLEAGTGSLGGARPKASVRDGDRLLIAKFASPRDAWDVIAWEKTALDLAERAGIEVPRRRLHRIHGKAVLLLDRFDRTDRGARIPYVSAMTLLTTRDGASDADYVDLAEALSEQGAITVKADLVELWRRVAFSVAVHNTDDHLRNHGFLRGTAGWTPSPMFDVNPNPDVATQRLTGIGTAHARDEELDGLMSSAATFGLTDHRARLLLHDVAAATSEWRQTATRNGIDDREQSLMTDAFDGLRPAIASLDS
ncbi:type II toxin-antitoxin system HipA family toxin [Nostocoides japonicum]|uniref:type II toxin-antitoxin system HipA family toxin n=1 Tax=Nostocoides japonicum TaxID=99481 RepID=UPI001F31FA65|nr:HipA domain-containing protein [Tetrasphaera japonica]